MAGTGIIVDTSILIEFLRAKDKPATVFWDLMGKHACCISSVTLFELAAGARSEHHKADIIKLKRWTEIISFGQQCAGKAAELYQLLKPKNELPEFRDLFIAATALARNLPLATSNRKHFRNIPDLQLVQ